jgi:hypothetical protein
MLHYLPLIVKKLHIDSAADGWPDFSTSPPTTTRTQLSIAWWWRWQWCHCASWLSVYGTTRPVQGEDISSDYIILKHESLILRNWRACVDTVFRHMSRQASKGGGRACISVANMASYAISSSKILVIHDNMINETNNIIYYVFVDISRSQGCKNTKCQIEKIVYFLRVKNKKGKKKKGPTVPSVHSVGVVGTLRNRPNEVHTIRWTDSPVSRCVGWIAEEEQRKQ